MALSDLEAALETLDAKILEVFTNPKPNYSIDGQSVSWDDHRQKLLDQRKGLMEALQMAGGPVERISIGVS